ncbi:MAG: DUF1223 domain-containing protein [Pseudomonadota bacterium]
MRKLAGLLSAGLISASTALMAENVTVVELYTSQGCSSCPPADKILHELAAQDDVIALALHVDYWDYIGWKDEFADPDHTERQKGYARAAGARSIYTPQMVIGGMDHVVGSRPAEVAEHLTNHAKKKAMVDVAGTRDGNSFTVVASPYEPIDDGVDVHVVTYRPSSTVDIRRGENAGRTLDYANVVTSWDYVGRWSTSDEFELKASVSNDDPVVVIFQRPDHGEIVGAVQLR